MGDVLSLRLLRYAACLLLACVGALVVAVPVLGRTAAVTMVGAGDIAYCGGDRDAATARLVRRIPGTVFTLGDNVYDRGTAREFRNCYDPTWGTFKKRTKPSVGNHEYYTRGAAPYYDYFGRKAGPRGKGYYSYDRGAWHVVVLNSNCDRVGCGPRSAQVAWLRADLSRNPARCTLAYFHHPLFSSNAPSRDVRTFWQVLYNRRADVILAGHAHSYERFRPMRPDGTRAPKRGIRSFVVGTGGKPPERPFDPRPANLVVRNDKTPGVLRLTLRSGSYSWKFVPVAGKTFTDSGRGVCH